MGRESKFIFIYSYLITKNSICNESLVESIFQTAGKAWTMRRAQFVHFVLSSGFMITVNIVRLEELIKLGKISVTSHTQLARIALMIASSVVLSRALKQTEQ